MTPGQIARLISEDPDEYAGLEDADAFESDGPWVHCFFKVIDGEPLNDFGIWLFDLSRLEIVPDFERRHNNETHRSSMYVKLDYSDCPAGHAFGMASQASKDIYDNTVQTRFDHVETQGQQSLKQFPSGKIKITGVEVSYNRY